MGLRFPTLSHVIFDADIQDAAEFSFSSSSHSVEGAWPALYSAIPEDPEEILIRNEAENAPALLPHGFSFRESAAIEELATAQIQAFVPIVYELPEDLQGLWIEILQKVNVFTRPVTAAPEQRVQRMASFFKEPSQTSRLPESFSPLGFMKDMAVFLSRPDVNIDSKEQALKLIQNLLWGNDRLYPCYAMQIHYDIMAIFSDSVLINLFDEILNDLGRDDAATAYAARFVGEFGPLMISHSHHKDFFMSAAKVLWRPEWPHVFPSKKILDQSSKLMMFFLLNPVEIPESHLLEILPSLLKYFPNATEATQKKYTLTRYDWAIRAYRASQQQGFKSTFLKVFEYLQEMHSRAPGSWERTKKRAEFQPESVALHLVAEYQVYPHDLMQMPVLSDAQWEVVAAVMRSRPFAGKIFNTRYHLILVTRLLADGLNEAELKAKCQEYLKSFKRSGFIKENHLEWYLDQIRILNGSNRTRPI